MTSRCGCMTIHISLGGRHRFKLNLTWWLKRLLLECVCKSNGLEPKHLPLHWLTRTLSAEHHLCRPIFVLPLDGDNHCVLWNSLDRHGLWIIPSNIKNNQIEQSINSKLFPSLASGASVPLSIKWRGLFPPIGSMSLWELGLAMDFGCLSSVNYLEKAVILASHLFARLWPDPQLSGCEPSSLLFKCAIPVTSSRMSENRCVKACRNWDHPQPTPLPEIYAHWPRCMKLSPCE